MGPHLPAREAGKCGGRGWVVSVTKQKQGVAAGGQPVGSEVWKWPVQLMTVGAPQRPSSKAGQADGASEDSPPLDVQKLKEKRDVLDEEISQLASE